MRKKLRARFDEMQAEIDSLREHIDAAPEISYVRELHTPPPISEPLDVFKLAAIINEQHAYYDEAGDVYGANLYL